MTTKISVKNDGPNDVRVNGKLLKAGEDIPELYIYGAQGVTIVEVDEFNPEARLLNQVRQILAPKGEDVAT